MKHEACRQYPVWQLPVRLFHWINFLSVFSLIVVRAEVTEGGGLISAMFSGYKVLDKLPVDAE